MITSLCSLIYYAPFLFKLLENLKGNMLPLIFNLCNQATYLESQLFRLMIFSYLRYPIDGAHVMPPMDFTKESCQTAITQKLGGSPVDVVLSDMVQMMKLILFNGHKSLIPI